MLLECDLVKDVKWILHRHAPHMAEFGFCAQFAYFRLRKSYCSQSFAMMGERTGHAVEDADAVEEGTEQPDVFFQPVRTVDFQADIVPVRLQPVADGAQQPARINRVMHDIEGGDDIVLFRQSLGYIPEFKAHAISHASGFGVGSCLLNRWSKAVVTDITRTRKGLGQLDESLAVSAAHISHERAPFQFRLYLWHGWQPYRHQQVLEPAVGKARHTLP